MKLRSLSIYFAVFVALIAWLYFWEIKHKGQEKAAKEEAEKIVRIAKDKVVDIDIESKKNGKIAVRKPGKEWILSAPVTTKADEAEVDRLLTSASGAKSERIIAEKDVKWEEYGLDKPELTVLIATPEKKVRLSFGGLNPSKTSYYLRVGDDPRLFLVADTLKNSMDKSTFDLREKTVLGIAPEDVDRVVFKGKGKDTELKREGSDQWRMVRPEQFRVKSAMLNKTLIDLTNLQADGIIDEPKKEGDPYGLDQPEEEVTLAGKKLEQTLLVGKEAKSGKGIGAPGTRYARIKGREPVYEINVSTLAPLQAEPQVMRDRSLVDVKPTQVEKVEIDLDGKKWIAAKSSDKEWKLEEPTKGPIEAWEITSIIWDLKGLEWKTMSKPTPSNPGPLTIEKPKLTISLKVQDKKEPIVLKASWSDESGKTPDEPKQGTEVEQNKNPLPSDENAPKKELSAAAAEAKIPKILQLQVEPCEEKGALFTVDGRYIERLRGALEEVGKKK
jgi:hypothetical protein